MATPIALTYIGEDPRTRFIPDWPASDHDEPDHALAVEKVASGLYRAVGAADGSDLAPRLEKRLERAAEAAAQPAASAPVSPPSADAAGQPTS